MPEALPPLPPGATVTFARSETIAAFAAAMAKAQLEMGTAKKNAKNPHYGSPYADLEAVMDVARVPLAKNGIAILQPPCVDSRGAGVTTLLLHASGEWMSCELILPLAKRDPHGIGSNLTYSRRYGASAMLSIPTGEGEDDGNASSDIGPKGEGKKEAPKNQAAKRSQTEAAKEKLGLAVSKPDNWQRLVELGALYGFTEDKMRSFCKPHLHGKRPSEITTEDVQAIQQALSIVAKSPNGQIDLEAK